MPWPRSLSGFSFYAASELASQLSGDFTNMLDGVNFLMPGERSAQKNNLLSWFDELGIQPKVVADAVQERFYGISPERKHTAAEKIFSEAKRVMEEPR